MLGISTTVGVLLGGLLGVWLFVTDKSGLFPRIHFNHIVKVLLNEARSGLVRSITILIIATLSTSSAAGLIGGGGLGYLGIRYGHQRYMPEVMHTVLLALSALVITIQAAGSYLAAKLDKR